MGLSDRAAIKRRIREIHTAASVALDDVYKTVDVVGVDLNIELYAVVGVSDSYKDMVRRMTAIPQREFNRFPNATVFLGLFDQYDYVPQGKVITQTSRDNSKVPFSKKDLKRMGDFSYVSAMHKMTETIEVQMEAIYGDFIGVVGNISTDGVEKGRKTAYRQFVKRLLNTRSRKEDFIFHFARCLLLSDAVNQGNKVELSAWPDDETDCDDEPDRSESGFLFNSAYRPTGHAVQDIFGKAAANMTPTELSKKQRIIVDGCRWPNTNVQSDWKQWGLVTSLPKYSHSCEDYVQWHVSSPPCVRRPGSDGKPPETPEKFILPEDLATKDPVLAAAWEVNAGSLACPVLMPSTLGKCAGVRGEATIISESLPAAVGEPDVRVVRWMATFEPGTVFWFDCCDTDLIVILLMHMDQFYDHRKRKFSIQVYLNLTCGMSRSRPRGTANFHESRLFSTPIHKNNPAPKPWKDAYELVDINALWMSITTKFKRWWPKMHNPVETYCLWATLAGTDYVPSWSDLKGGHLWDAFVRGGWVLLSAACSITPLPRRKSGMLAKGILPSKRELLKRTLKIDETLTHAFIRFAYTYKCVVYYGVDPLKAWPECPPRQCDFLKDLRRTTTCRYRKWEPPKNTPKKDDKSRKPEKPMLPTILERSRRYTIDECEKIADSSYQKLMEAMSMTDEAARMLRIAKEAGGSTRHQQRDLKEELSNCKALRARHDSNVMLLYDRSSLEDAMGRLKSVCWSENDLLREIYNAAWPVEAIMRVYTAKTKLGTRKVDVRAKIPSSDEMVWRMASRNADWNLSYWLNGPYESVWTDNSLMSIDGKSLSGFERDEKGVIVRTPNIWMPESMLKVIEKEGRVRLATRAVVKRPSKPATSRQPKRRRNGTKDVREKMRNGHYDYPHGASRNHASRRQRIEL